MQAILLYARVGVATTNRPTTIAPTVSFIPSVAPTPTFYGELQWLPTQSPSSPTISPTTSAQPSGEIRNLPFEYFFEFLDIQRQFTKNETLLISKAFKEAYTYLFLDPTILYVEIVEQISGNVTESSNETDTLEARRFLHEEENATSRGKKAGEEEHEHRKLRRSLLARFRGLSLCRRCPKKRYRDPLYDAGTKRPSDGNRKTRTTRNLEEDEMSKAVAEAFLGFSNVRNDTNTSNRILRTIDFELDLKAIDSEIDDDAPGSGILAFLKAFEFLLVSGPNSLVKQGLLPPLTVGEVVVGEEIVDFSDMPSSAPVTSTVSPKPSVSSKPTAGPATSTQPSPFVSETVIDSTSAQPSPSQSEAATESNTGIDIDGGTDSPISSTLTVPTLSPKPSISQIPTEIPIRSSKPTISAKPTDFPSQAPEDSEIDDPIESGTESPTSVATNPITDFASVNFSDYVTGDPTAIGTDSRSTAPTITGTGTGTGTGLPTGVASGNSTDSVSDGSTGIGSDSGSGVPTNTNEVSGSIESPSGFPSTP
eukprot:scaffold158642_cov39-Attheya_sp.AAC.1